MRFAVITHDGLRQWAVDIGDAVVPASRINERFKTDFPFAINAFIASGRLKELESLLSREHSRDPSSDKAPHLPRETTRLRQAIEELGIPISNIRTECPSDRPERVLAIGLNYRQHASDLGAVPPQDPATFLRPWSAVIGPGEPIILPHVSKRVTAEGELALIFGKRCRDVPEEHALDVIFGATVAIDVTAEDVIRENPRFLTRSKGFDNSLSLGPRIVTLDEIPDLASVRVSTEVNGVVAAENTVAHMINSPPRLIHVITQGATFYPGDVLCTGTPGAAPIKEGDVVRATVSHVGELSNPVVADERARLTS